MACNVVYGRQQLQSLVGATWVANEYMQHRAETLFQRQRARLTEVQVLVEVDRAHETRVAQVNELRVERAALKRRIDQLDGEIRDAIQAPIARPSVRRAFVAPCARTGCAGFLSSVYKCAACEGWTCPDCHAYLGEERDPTHVCDEAQRLSVQMLRGETRLCPGGCGARLQHAGGCDQMYCTMPGCRTVFSWSTGRIDHGRVHNPYALDFIRQHGSLGRDLADIPCGGRPSMHELVRAVPSMRRRDDTSARRATCFFYLMEHLDRQLIDEANRAQRDPENDDRLCVAWVRGRVTEEAFRRGLALR